MKKTSTDLTQGNIAGQIVVFALPILLGQIFQNLYNSVDSIVVGNYVGKVALAAVTSSSDISQLLVGFFTGLSTGSGVLFSRYFGAKNNARLHDAIHTAMLFAVILGVAIAGAGILLAPLLLHVVDCPADVYDAALAYLRVYLVGVLFTALYNVAAGILRAVGDSRSPFIYLVITSITNIIMDLLFVRVFHMGVIGAAVATIISQLLSVTLAFHRLMTTSDVYKLVLKDLRIRGDILKEVLILGLPAAIQAALISISNLFVQRYLNGFGADAMAGTGAAKKIDRFVGMVAQSLGMAVTTFIGQNVGAKRYDRAFKGLRICLYIAFGTAFAMGLPIYLSAGFFISLFLKAEETEAIRYGAWMIEVMMPLYFFQVLNNIFANAVRGFGKSIVTMFTSIFGMIVCRQIFLAITMAHEHTIVNVFRAYPFGWACAALMSIGYYLIAIRIPYTKKMKESAAK